MGFMRNAKQEHVQLPHLETFSKAAEWGSFTAAAKALRLTQAAVSQRVHALERTLRVSLFQRRGAMCCSPRRASAFMGTHNGFSTFTWKPVTS